MTATEQAHRVFTRAAISDEDLGYPDTVGFLACDLPRWEDMLWRDLTEERVATVVVDENALETMFIPVERPLPLRLVDRARRRVSVRIRWRHGLDAPSGDLRVSLNRSGIAAMNLGSKPAPQ
jgi:hypothetical protein